jgi:hypothetical protein
MPVEVKLTDGTTIKIEKNREVLGVMQQLERPHFQQLTDERSGLAYYVNPVQVLYVREVQ